MTYNLDGSIRKPGSGRTKGAVSLVPVRFGDLKTYLNDDTQVLMGRKFLESIGFLAQKEAVDRQDPKTIVEVKELNIK